MERRGAAFFKGSSAHQVRGRGGRHPLLTLIYIVREVFSSICASLVALSKGEKFVYTTLKLSPIYCDYLLQMIAVRQHSVR